MKRIILSLVLMSALCGCVELTKTIQHEETDVVGIQAESPNVLNYGTAVNVKIGVIHQRYYSIPTSTNQVYTAPYNYSLGADIGIMQQKVTNNISTK